MSKQVILQPLPSNARGAYAVAGITGSMPFTLAENGILFAFQWTDTLNYAVINELHVNFGVSSTITTAVMTAVGLCRVHDFFNAYTGGSSLLGVAPDLHEKKLKSNFPQSLAADIRIANTTILDLPLVPGTLDGVNHSVIMFGTGTAVGAAGLSPEVPLFERKTNDFPFVIDTNEGFVVRMALNGPATGNMRFAIGCKWTEMTKQFV